MATDKALTSREIENMVQELQLQWGKLIDAVRISDTYAWVSLDGCAKVDVDTHDLHPKTHIQIR